MAKVDGSSGGGSNSIRRVALKSRFFLHDIALKRSRVCIHYLFNGFFPELTLWMSGCCLLITFTLFLTECCMGWAAFLQDREKRKTEAENADDPGVANRSRAVRHPFLLFHSAGQFFCLGVALLLLLTLLFRMMTTGDRVVLRGTSEAEPIGGKFHGHRRSNRSGRRASPEGTSTNRRSADSSSSTATTEEETSRALPPFMVQKGEDLDQLTDSILRTMKKVLRNVILLTAEPVYTSGKEVELAGGKPGCIGACKTPAWCQSQRQRAKVFGAIALASWLIPKFPSVSCFLTVVNAWWVWRTWRLKR